MTDKQEKAAEKEQAKKDERAENRVSPDSPLGVNDGQGEQDFYQKQRRDSPDGMTAAERDQYQKGAPGALDQRAGEEKVGEAEDEANPAGVHKEQHP